MRIAIYTKQLTILVILTIIIITPNTSKFQYPKETQLIDLPVFSGNRALGDVAYQVSLGPRTMGSYANRQVGNWLIDQLRASEWEVLTQDITWENQPIRNIIARRGHGNPWILIGAHYDTRFISENDPDPTMRLAAGVGANDGASGVAVLLELARVVPKELEKEIWLVFFDAEDNGRIENWDWILGSQALVNSLMVTPDKVVIVDMVGDSNLQLFMEKNSDQALNQEIWDLAMDLGYSQFIPTYRYRILDDHVPFLRANVPAIDIIDFDYPYWHTTQDTLDKLSASSLEAVGATLLAWIMQP
jgi:Zn-dependent M28 family amino/carboxypeptidase